jgi:hypothetical protein
VTDEQTKPPAATKRVREKTSASRDKSSSVVSDDSSADKASDSKEEPDELGSLSSKLLDKLAEEESKLKKVNNLEIGTWSNEMAENVENFPEDGDEVKLLHFVTFVYVSIDCIDEGTSPAVCNEANMGGCYFAGETLYR